jgi:hypothetical protein
MSAHSVDKALTPKSYLLVFSKDGSDHDDYLFIHRLDHLSAFVPENQETGDIESIENEGS